MEMPEVCHKFRSEVSESESKTLEAHSGEPPLEPVEAELMGFGFDKTFAYICVMTDFLGQST